MLLSRRAFPPQRLYATTATLAFASSVSLHRVPFQSLEHATQQKRNASKKSTVKSSQLTSQKRVMSKRTSYERSELGHTTTKRAKQVDENLPYDQLQEALGAQDENTEVTKVAHWFH